MADVYTLNLSFESRTNITISLSHRPLIVGTWCIDVILLHIPLLIYLTYMHWVAIYRRELCWIRVLELKRARYGERRWVSYITHRDGDASSLLLSSSILNALSDDNQCTSTTKHFKFYWIPLQEEGLWIFKNAWEKSLRFF